MGVVVGLTFLFGIGNVLNLALQLGVPAWVAPLVAPAVDLSILFASVVTLALNVAEPLVAGEFGKAAFDAVRATPPDRLRVRLGVGAARARKLVKIVRSEFEEQVAAHRPAGDVVNEMQDAATMAA